MLDQVKLISGAGGSHRPNGQDAGRLTGDGHRGTHGRAREVADMVRGFALSRTGDTEDQMVTGDMAERWRMVVTEAVMKQSVGREMERSVSTSSSPEREGMVGEA
jgi:hypothetical protein